MMIKTRVNCSSVSFSGKNKTMAIALMWRTSDEGKRIKKVCSSLLISKILELDATTTTTPPFQQSVWNLKGKNGVQEVNVSTL